MFQIIYILNSVFFQIYFSDRLIYNVHFAFCFLLLSLACLLLCALFSFLLSEIKVDELGKRQEIRDKKRDCR